MARVIEDYFEFTVGRWFARVWIHADKPAHIAPMKSLAILKESVLEWYSLDVRSQGQVAEYISTLRIEGIGKMSAVQVQNHVTGFGVIIYPEWP